MDAYPKDYVAHSLPFILISGLGDSFDHDGCPVEEQYPLLKENGIQIESDFPTLTGSFADDLLSAFRDHDASDAPSNSRAHTSQVVGNGWRVKTINRVSSRPLNRVMTGLELPTTFLVINFFSSFFFG